MADTNLREFDTSTLAGRCAEETQHYLHHRPHNEKFCYELFRRAVLDRDILARESINQVYALLVNSWVVRVAPKLGDEDQAILINDETDHFWSSYSAEKFKRALYLAQILKYWETCVSRATRKVWLKIGAIEQIEPDVELIDPNYQPVPDIVDERIKRRAVWKIILSHCHDDLDQLIARRMIIEDMPPREIFESERNKFPNIQDVYRRIRNLTDRLKRDQRLKRLWEESE